MMEIFEMRDGRPVRTDEIKPDVWINLTAPTAEEIEQVQSALRIDREALTSALDDEEGSRTEVSKDYTLILIDAPTREWRNNREEFTTYPLSITVTDTAIVTVCLQELFALTNIASGKAKSKSIYDVANRARFVLQILFRVAINYQTDLKYIEVKRMAIEESIRKATRRDDLFELHELESNLVYFKTSLSVNVSIIDRMSKQSRFVSTEEDRDLMDDVIIETNQALEMTTTYSQIIKGTRQLVEADLNNSLALVMKLLTSITLIISIPTMLASFYGMNVKLPGDENPYMYIILMIAMVASCVLSIWGLKRKGLWRRSQKSQMQSGTIRVSPASMPSTRSWTFFLRRISLRWRPPKERMPLPSMSETNTYCLPQTGSWRPWCRRTRTMPDTSPFS